MAARKRKKNPDPYPFHRPHEWIQKYRGDYIVRAKKGSQTFVYDGKHFGRVGRTVARGYDTQREAIKVGTRLWLDHKNGALKGFQLAVAMKGAN